MEKELGVEVLPARAAEACVAEADVVVTITNSAEPVCRAEWLAAGAHVNVAGANASGRREVDAETVLRAAVKATDHVEQAKVEAGEFRELVAAGKLAWSAIRELGELITGKATGRTSPSDVTLFKSLGIALEDVAFAELVYQRALAAGVGRPIPIGRAALPRNRLPQNFPRGLRAVELTQRAAFDLPALRRAHELPAVRRHPMHSEALGAAVVGDVDGIALRLRHQDLQIGRDGRGVALDRDMGQGGEMRKPALDRRLVVGAEHLIGDAVAPARAGEILVAVEHAVFHPTRCDMVLASGVGAGRVAGDQVVDLEPVFDGADSVFAAPIDAHVIPPTERFRTPDEWPFAIRHPLVRSLPRPMEISPPRDDFADGAGVVGGEEQPAIGNRDDGACPAAVDRNRIFTDHLAVRRHAADLVGKILGEPEIAVGCHRDAA